MLTLYPLLVLSMWAISDWKTGRVNAFLLFVPAILTYALFPWKFVAVFIPVFATLTIIWFLLRKRGLFGFADVIGLPFTLSYLIDLSPFGVIAFSGIFAFLVINQMNEKYDEKLGVTISNRIILLPILFISYLIGFLTHLIFVLIF